MKVRIHTGKQKAAVGAPDSGRHGNGVDKTSPLDTLRKLWLENNRQKCPRFPEDHRRAIVPRYSDKTSNGLTKMVQDFLRLSGHHAERVSSTGSYRKTRTGYKWIKSTGTKGSSDLHCVINGQFIAVEIKCAATRDRQSPAQKAYQQKIEISGGRYVIAKTFDQFYQWYQTAFNSNL